MSLNTEFKIGFITIMSEIDGFIGMIKNLLWVIILVLSTIGISKICKDVSLK